MKSDKIKIRSFEQRPGITKWVVDYYPNLGADDKEVNIPFFSIWATMLLIGALITFAHYLGIPWY